MSILAANPAAPPSLSPQDGGHGDFEADGTQLRRGIAILLDRFEPLKCICDCRGLLQPKHRRELWSRVRLPLCIPPFAWSLLRGHFGARRHGAALLRLRRPSGHGSSLKGALQESAAWHLGAGPTRLASPGVTQARSGNSTNGDTIMYQNKVTLIGFLGSDAEVRSQRQPQLHHTLAGNQVLIQERWQVHLAHRMAPLRCLRQALGIRRHAEEGRAYPGGRRAPQPGIRQQEDGLKAAHLGNQGRFDSEA